MLHPSENLNFGEVFCNLAIGSAGHRRLRSSQSLVLLCQKVRPPSCARDHSIGVLRKKFALGETGFQNSTGMILPIPQKYWGWNYCNHNPIDSRNHHPAMRGFSLKETIQLSGYPHGTPPLMMATVCHCGKPRPLRDDVSKNPDPCLTEASI